MFEAKMRRSTILATISWFGVSSLVDARDLHATTVAPCAQVSSAWTAQIKTNPTPTVAASLAYDCLSSVPLNKTAAIQLVDAIEPYLDFQTDYTYKADPPSDYHYPPYDFFANLARVKANLEADVYKNELGFQQDLYLQVWGKGHDGHFVFYPDALTKVFRHKRAISLVSISENGHPTPVIKLYDDVAADPKKASAVSAINGIPAEKYLLDTIVEASSNQDLDAAYNSMFYGLARAALRPSLRGYFSGGGRIGYLYHGPTTNLTFSNGTTAEFQNFAAVTGNMTGVNDGDSFYKVFCVPKNHQTSDGHDSTSSRSAAPRKTSIHNYPEPVIASHDGTVSGYYLDGEGLDDVAVISLLSLQTDAPVEFQAVCREFFKLAVAAGKTRLVVDLQANEGGVIFLAYDFFRQLFPDVLQDGFSRWKGNESFLQLARVFSNEAAHIDPDTSDDSKSIVDYMGWYNYRYDLNQTNQRFLTFQDKFGPHIYKNTSFSAIMRWNLSDPMTTANASFGVGMDISGYRSLANISQPFGADDIILLYDGVCGSSCSILSEMLRIQGGVKAVAFGGRPIKGPMQGVGGTKGAQMLSFREIYQFTQRAINVTRDERIKKDLSKFTMLPIQRSTMATLNVRDQILRDHLSDGRPAQYVVEHVDCRLYWTAEMVTDVRAIWRAGANVAFNGHRCVDGGIMPPSIPASPHPRPCSEKRDGVGLEALAASAETRLAAIRARWAVKMFQGQRVID